MQNGAARQVHPRHLPEMQGRRPVWRFLRGLRLDISADRPDQSPLRQLRNNAGTETIRALFLQAGRLRKATAGYLSRPATPSNPSPTSSMNGSAPVLRTGTSHATAHTSASKSPAKKINTSTSGSTRPSAIWPQPKITATKTTSISTPSGTAPITSFTISSARTLCISTPCSGPRCSSGAGFKTANKLFVHGFLTVNGQKMSKSRGTFYKGRDLPQTPRPRIPAILLREQTFRRHRRHRPEHRGLRK